MIGRPPSNDKDSRGRPAILQVIASAERRGAEVFASDLHSELAGRGWPISTVALVPGARKPHLPIPSLGTKPLSPETLLRLRGLAGTSEAVVAHGSTTLPATAAATLVRRLPWVYRTIGDPRYWRQHWMTRQRVRLLLATASRIVVLWSGAADALEEGGMARRRIVVIPNGVPSTRFPLADNLIRDAARGALDPHGRLTGPVVGFVGSLTAEKGAAIAVEAVGAIAGAHLLIAGDGPLRRHLVAHVARVAPGRVHFLGVTDQPQRVLAAADVIVVPSHTEGMAAVLIEAGLSGRPVVASDVGAVREVVIDGTTGLIVPPGDPLLLASGIQRAIDQGLGGQVAREWCIARFDLTVVADAWSDVLKSVAGT